jgi:hypothetical protein
MITHNLFVRNMCRLQAGFGHAFERPMFVCALVCAPPSSRFLVHLHALGVCLCVGVCTAFERVFSSPSRAQRFIRN